MCGQGFRLLFRWTIFLIVVLCFCFNCNAKLTDDNRTTVENKIINKMGNAGMALVFVEELKILMERQLLGICPQSYKSQMASKAPKNATVTTCEAEIDPQEIAGRLASLALRAHSAARSSECSRLGTALANAFGELARAAAHKQHLANSAAIDAGKKRKLSKSQKAKIQAKQRTALAVKKKAAAIAAKLSL